MAEEHGGEEGLLEDAKNDKDKLTKASVAARLKEILPERQAPAWQKGRRSRAGARRSRSAPDEYADERKVLRDYLALIEKKRRPPRSEDSAGRIGGQGCGEIRPAHRGRDQGPCRLKTNGWPHSPVAVQSELDRISQALTGASDNSPSATLPRFAAHRRSRDARRPRG